MEDYSEAPSLEEEIEACQKQRSERDLNAKEGAKKAKKRKKKVAESTSTADTSLDLLCKRVETRQNQLDVAQGHAKTGWNCTFFTFGLQFAFPCYEAYANLASSQSQPVSELQEILPILSIAIYSIVGPLVTATQFGALTHFRKPERKYTPTTDGPYAYMRHPIYLGVRLLTTATYCISPTLMSLIPLALHYAASEYTARLEERCLEIKYGKAYHDYKEKVPRWIPQFYKK